VYSSGFLTIEKTPGPALDWRFASGSLNAMGDESGSSPSQAAEQPSSSPSRSEPAAFEVRFTLLLVEDNLPDVLLVKELIRIHNLPFEVHVAADGQEAIDFITKAGSDASAPQPQFLLLDLNLPKKDGFEVLRHVRATTAFTGIPVLIMSSSDSPADREKAAELRAVYFRKPPSYAGFMKLTAILKDLLTSSGAQ
jgi:chemotaxis family two-component system response regulator Rcp1